MRVPAHWSATAGRSPAKGLVGLTAVFGGVAIAGLMVVPPANAATTTAAAPPRTSSQAIPREITGCFVVPDGDDAVEAYCGGSTPSKFRAWVICTGGEGLRYGPWRIAGAGTTSYVACGFNHFVSDDGVETQG
ncbi:MAG TPA: hypothetical protein VFB06_14670 [Streptosporangiaceae bacterium]|nr:hypothetical protein [Streptosporangiaceae bacterium]